MIIPTPYTSEIPDFNDAIFDAEHTWTLPQTTQISASNYIFHTILPEAADTYSKPFNWIASSFTNTDDTENFVFRIGNNLANGGGPVDATRSTVFDEWESHYVYGGVDVVERHMGFKAVGLGHQRFLTFIGRSDGLAPVNADQNCLGFVCDGLYIKERTNTTQYLRVDAANGFAVTNLEQGLSVAMTSAGDGIRMSAAANSTGNYFSLDYNSGTIMSVNQHGEWNIAGAGTATGLENSMLKVRGRTGTPNALQVDSINGDNRLQIASDGSYLINTCATTYFRGSDLLIQNAATVTKFAVINATGAIWTNQRIAATALASPGTVTGRVELFTEAGVSIGSFPLYANGSFS